MLNLYCNKIHHFSSEQHSCAKISRKQPSTQCNIIQFQKMSNPEATNLRFAILARQEAEQRSRRVSKLCHNIISIKCPKLKSPKCSFRARAISLAVNSYTQCDHHSRRTTANLRNPRGTTVAHDAQRSSERNGDAAESEILGSIISAWLMTLMTSAARLSPDADGRERRATVSFCGHNAVFPFLYNAPLWISVITLQKQTALSLSSSDAM